MTNPGEKDDVRLTPQNPSAHHSPLTTHHSPTEPWTVTRLVDWTAQYLAQKGMEFPRLDAEVLLAHCLSWSRIDLYARYDQIPPEETRKQFKTLIGRRLEGCPVAYLVGRKEFFGLALEVSPAVLIPRPESEYVVLECLRLAKENSQPHVLDIGTGSGNLAIAVAHQHPGAQVTAIDISPEALAVAGRVVVQEGRIAPRACTTICVLLARALRHMRPQTVSGSARFGSMHPRA